MRSLKLFVLFGYWPTLLLFALSCQLAWGQATIATGAVRGVVADNSGAMILSASVLLISRDNGQSISRPTNSSGVFLFPSQPVGLYAVEVSAPGFRKEIVEPVLVQVGQTTAVSARLQTGS